MIDLYYDGYDDEEGINVDAYSSKRAKKLAEDREMNAYGEDEAIWNELDTQVEDETKFFDNVQLLSPQKIQKIQGDMSSKSPNVREMAKNEAADCFKPLIKSIISKYFNPYMKKYYDDMYQAGQCGVWMHFKEYNPDCAAPTTFFRTHIIHEIQMFISEYVSQSSRYYNDTAKKISEAKNRLYKLGYDDNDITPQILADYTGTKLVTIKETLRTMEFTKVAQFDPNMKAKQEETDPQITLIKNEEKRVVDNVITSLTKQEQIVFESISLEIMTKKELEAKLNITSAKVDEIYARAKKKLYANEKLKEILGIKDPKKPKSNDMGIPILRFKSEQAANFFSDDIEEIERHFG